MRELVRAAGLLLVLVSVVTSQDCTTGEARLVDFTNGNLDSNKGIVQVCYNGGWTTVCGGSRWGVNPANVVCKQLGYSEYTTLSRLYTGDTQTIFSGARQYAYLASSCGGDERVLTDCIMESGSPTNCYYAVQGSTNDGYYYATVICQPNNCNDTELRLVNGTSYREGRVEVCVDGHWGTVCGEGWTNEDAGHVCTRLGYPSTVAITSSYGQGTGPVYDLICQPSSQEANAINCTATNTSCDHSQDLGVQCDNSNETVTTETSASTLSTTLSLPITREKTSTQTTNDYTTMEETEETASTKLRVSTCNTEQMVSMSTMLGVGVFSGLTTVALVTVIIGWIITCVYYQQKMKTQLTKHTPSQPPTQTSHPHTDVMYDYIDKIPAPPPGSCDLTTNEAYNSVVHCVTNDSYSVIHAS